MQKSFIITKAKRYLLAKIDAIFFITEFDFGIFFYYG